jgi:hypothetical protein
MNYAVSPNALFRGGPNPHLNACVGDNGGPYDLAHYGYAFIEGARAIIASAVSGAKPVDALIYPAAFSFRHGIELYLKQLLLNLQNLNESVAVSSKGHSIDRLWRLVAKEMALVGPEGFDPIEVSIATDIISEFCEIDPTGQVFRYPEDLSGNRHLTGLGIINVEVLGGGMDVLVGLLSQWHSHSEDLIAFKRDSRP